MIITTFIFIFQNNACWYFYYKHWIVLVRCFWICQFVIDQIVQSGNMRAPLSKKCHQNYVINGNIERRKIEVWREKYFRWQLHISEYYSNYLFPKLLSQCHVIFIAVQIWFLLECEILLEWTIWDTKILYYTALHTNLTSNLIIKFQIDRQILQAHRLKLFV